MGMENKRIEEAIRDLLNTSVIGYSCRQGGRDTKYFVEITRKNIVNKYFIEEDEVRHFGSLIELAGKERASKKSALKDMRKAKLQAKIDGRLRFFEGKEEILNEEEDE